MKGKKIAVAMSGGVDSGVAAALVAKAGFQATGFYMQLWSEPVSGSQRRAPSFENKCCSSESLEAARKTAHQLGISFYTINLEKIFKKRVVDYFLKEYGLGQTPNPCVMCNRFVKFGELLDYVKKLGYDYLATGHYARVMKDGRFHLLMGKDKIKDQSYFLYSLTQKQLTQVMFPVGDYFKKEVRAMAKKWKLPVAERPESQEICFFPEADYRPFLKRQIPKKIVSGEVVNVKRRVIGRHQGIPLYTIGQRHGFAITDKKVIGPLYVIGKNNKKNQLVVGFGKEAEINEFWVKNVHWLVRRSLGEGGMECKVRIRHQGELLKCKIRNVKGKIQVKLDEGERGVSPGQAAVFYLPAETLVKAGEKKAHEVLGGGTIAFDKGK
jgi:tRNA-specific 2-thiouridylase